MAAGKDDATAPTLANDATLPSDASGAPAIPSDAGALATVAATTYTILGEHGRGGLGRILRARDERTGRVVAIKEVLAGHDEAAARFVREAIVTANLQHPAIVPVYEVGRWPNGQPFYAMKLVAGRTLSAAITDAADRVSLLPHVAAVADALAYAHEAGVIHRDLKPSNVLVGAFGETVVIDWGLAKRTNDDHEIPLPEIASGETISGSVMGTPAYMPPEQAIGGAVDARSDVYAIGAMLYHLLAGAPPYADSKDGGEVITRVRTGKPPAPLPADVAPDLRAIVAKAMSRAPELRYPSAAELARDLRAFMTGGLVAAHRYTTRQRLARWIRKHRAPVAVAALATIALGVFGAYSIRRIVRERDGAETAQHESTDRLARSYEDRARVELLAEHPQRALPLVVEAMKLGRDTQTLRFLGARAREALLPIATAHDVPVAAAVFASQGHDILIVHDGGVMRWDSDRDRVVWNVALAGAQGMSMPADEREPLLVSAPKKILMIDQPSGRVLGELPWSADVAAREPMFAHGLVLANDGGGRAFVWDASTHALVRTIETGGSIDGGAISPDGKRVAVASIDMQPQVATKLYDLASGAVIAELCPATAPCRVTRYLDDGRLVIARDAAHPTPEGWLAVDDGDGNRVWEATTRGAVRAIKVNHDQIVVGTETGMIEAFDPSNGKVVWQRQTRAPFDSLQIDDTVIIGIDSHAGVTLLARDGAAELATYAIDLTSAEPIFSRDGTRVAIVDFQHGVRVARLERAIDFLTDPPRVPALRAGFTPDGARLFVGNSAGALTTYTVATGAVERRTQAHVGHTISALDVDRAGARVVTGSPDQHARIWDVATGAQRIDVDHGATVRVARLSPDGARLLTAGRDGAVRRWDATTGAAIGAPLTLPSVLVDAAWSPDGARIAALDQDGYAAIWDAATGALERKIDGGEFGIGSSLAWSPDGRHLAIARHDPSPILIGAAGEHDVPLAAEDGGELQGLEAAFDHHGHVAITADDGRVRIWDVATGARALTLETSAVTWYLAWSPDDQMIVTGDRDGLVRIWDASTGVELASRRAPGEVLGVRFSPNGDAVAVTSRDGGLLWRIPSWHGDLDALSRLAACASGWHVRGDVLVWIRTVARCD
ncbi:MAG TPA: WD40 repeat domain-containing serine/threonine-protein kinase [Kofleriaceae bacterium]|nr:WD40 repeat domain-containing serine/threonine-protein kinase [Kofleriaceae bacterium]